MASKYPHSPLADAYFSDFNKERIQDDIIQSVKDKTGVSIARQSYSAVDSYMKVVFADKRRDTFSDVRQQVESMNKDVVKRTTESISTGLLQQIVYLRDIASNRVPSDIPISTSTYGNKIPINNKFGINP
jgi:phosphoheptose isomerase